MLQFSRPAFLLLLLALPWFWWHARRSILAVQTATVVLRCMIAALIITAAAGLHVRLRDGQLAVVYALDRSDSVSQKAQAGALARVNEWAATMRAGDRAGAIVFGTEAVVERGMTEHLRIPEVTSRVSGSATNIANALAASRAALPRQGSRRIVLLSDGSATVGDADREAALAAADGIRIDVVVPDDAQRRAPIRALRVVAPPTARAGEPFLGSVQFEGRPGGRGRLDLGRDGHPFISQDVIVGEDGTGSVTFTDALRQSGVYAYRASLRDGLDDDQGEDRGFDPGAMVSVAGEPSVLFVSTTSQGIAPLLAAGGFQVTKSTPETLPRSVAGLAAYDAVVLDDVPAERVDDSQSAAIAHYVEQYGGGLLLLGSSRSLGAAGYPSGPIGPILPLDLRPRSGRRAPSMSLVLVFDKSGSMADVADGVPKIELARQAVMKVLDVVPPSDRLGVIAFDSAPAIVAPLGTSHSVAAVAARLRNLAAGGPTTIAPAIEMAVDWLRGATASGAKRHVLLLSDGRTPAADADRVREAVRGQGIELSVVAIGADADRPMLERLAQSTGGRAYFPSDLRQLPLLVAREAARSSGGPVVEELFTLRAAEHPILTGIDRSALPQLRGYVVATGKPSSETILMSHLDDPVLSAWRAGLGKVAVYTADLSSSWSASFRTWHPFGQLWTQSLRWLSRRVDDRALSATLTEEAAGARLVVQAEQPDGRFISDLDVRATVRPPEGDTFEVALDAVAPGRYEAAVQAGSTGPYVVSISARAADGRVAEQQILRGFYWSADREHQARGVNTRALERVAEITRGRRLNPRESPFDGPRPSDYRDTSQWLSIFALLLFFGELAAGTFRDLRRHPRWTRMSSPSPTKDSQAA